MAEGGAEDVVLDDRNGCFQNQSEEASTSKRSSRRTSVETVSAWAELKKKDLHEEIAQLELLNTSRQRKEGRRKLCDFLVLPLIGSEKNRFDRPKQRPRHRLQPR